MLHCTKPLRDITEPCLRLAELNPTQLYQYIVAPHPTSPLLTQRNITLPRHRFA